VTSCVASNNLRFTSVASMATRPRLAATATVVTVDAGEKDAVEETTHVLVLREKKSVRWTADTQDTEGKKSSKCACMGQQVWPHIFSSLLGLDAVGRVGSCADAAHSYWCAQVAAFTRHPRRSERAQTSPVTTAAATLSPTVETSGEESAWGSRLVLRCLHRRQPTLPSEATSCFRS